MIEFFNKIFGRQPSGATAKERLRLVLMSDHLSLAPELIDAMKRDLVDVISRYVEVDREKIDVHFEHEDHGLAMLANIPITGVNRNNGNGSGDAKNEAPAPPPAAPSLDNGTALASAAKTPDTEPQSANGDPPTRQGEPVEPRPSAVEASTNAPRRKRRRRKNGTGSPAPAT